MSTILLVIKLLVAGPPINLDEGAFVMEAMLGIVFMLALLVVINTGI
jgi:hypothetical protein